MTRPPTATVALDLPLPQRLPSGVGTALFLYGHGDDPTAIVIGGERTPVTARAMPRPDRGGARDGWWASVTVAPHAGPGELVVQAETTSGPIVLGTIAIDPPAATADRDPALIAICMATCDPDERLLARQIDSIRAQEDTRWICVVADDRSSDAGLATIERVLDGDRRFVLEPGTERLGFYRNFERALMLAPPQAGLIALADHDDRWDPDKLATLRDALAGGALLAYSDMRLTDAGGRVLRDTLWHGRRNNSTDLVSMLVAGSVTGAASLLRREAVELALPFPDAPGLEFHDHWLALVALAFGELAYVQRPLYDYVQHRGAVFGEVSAGVRGRRRIDRRAAYFCGYLNRELLARTLLARDGGRIAPDKRRGLERFLAAQHHPCAAAWLAARSLRPLVGRDETLGSELELVQGLFWRLAVGTGHVETAAFPNAFDFEQRRLRRWRAAL